MEISNYSYNNIHKVPKVSGIYAWYLSPNNKGQALSIHDLFRDKKFNASIRGVFSETYIGKLTPFLKEVDMNRLDEDLLIDVFDLLNAPIYIGMSTNLNSRLNKHMQLINAYYMDNISYEESFSSIEPDTYEESSFFAMRITKKIKSSFLLNQLSVRVIQVDTSKKQLYAIENFLNRTLLPVLGRN